MFSPGCRDRGLECQTGRIALENPLNRAFGQRSGLFRRKFLDADALRKTARESPQGTLVIHIDPRTRALSVFPFVYQSR